MTAFPEWSLPTGMRRLVEILCPTALAVIALLTPGALLAESIDPAAHQAALEFLQNKDAGIVDLSLRTDIDTELDEEFDAAFEQYRKLRALVDREAEDEQRKESWGWQSGSAPFALGIFGDSVPFAMPPPASRAFLAESPSNLSNFSFADAPAQAAIPLRPDVPDHLRNYLARLQHAGPVH